MLRASLFSITCFATGVLAVDPPRDTGVFFNTRDNTPVPQVSFGLPVNPPPPAGKGASPAGLAPPGRIGAPMAANIGLQRWKASGSLDSFSERSPSLELDSRLTFALFDSPDAFFFDNLQFLNRVRASIEAPGLGNLTVDCLDRWNIARELLSRDLPPHLPEIHRLFWRWCAPGLPVATTVGRQRLESSGNRSLGSVSWMPDMQVFDGLRVDLGRAETTGKWTFGAFVDQAMASPYFGGPRPGETPVLLAAVALQPPGAGRWDAFMLAPSDAGQAGIVGIGWEQAPPVGGQAAVQRLHATLTPSGRAAGAGALPWHLSWHRQSPLWTWHIGAEMVGGPAEGTARVSSTPGTFRYIPGGPDDDVYNLFVGFDRRIDTSTMASITFQHLVDEDDGETTGQILETAIRHQLSPSAAFLAGVGCGLDEDSGTIFVRSGLQLSAAF